MRELFEKFPGEVAGVILEPVVGNSGYIEPTKEFLQACLPPRVNSGIRMVQADVHMPVSKSMMLCELFLYQGGGGFFWSPVYRIGMGHDLLWLNA